MFDKQQFSKQLRETIRKIPNIGRNQMITIQNYVRAQSLEEAWELNQKKRNRIVGGMLWMKMGRGSVQTAIDLCELGLDTIEESGEQFSIGAMVSLRQLEQHEGLNRYTCGAAAKAVQDIVGVQFRNLATVGGSVWGRFGFSDVLTVLTALEARVELYHAGVMTVEEFARQPMTLRDILVCVILPKAPRQTVYLSQRNISTDFPVVACAVSRGADGVVCAVGARPGKAVAVRDDAGLLAGGIDGTSAREFADFAARWVPFGSNSRAGADYRRTVCAVLVRRALLALPEQEG